MPCKKRIKALSAKATFIFWFVVLGILCFYSFGCCWSVYDAELYLGTEYAKRDVVCVSQVHNCSADGGVVFFSNIGVDGAELDGSPVVECIAAANTAYALRYHIDVTGFVKGRVRTENYLDSSVPYDFIACELADRHDDRYIPYISLALGGFAGLAFAFGTGFRW